MSYTYNKKLNDNIESLIEKELNMPMWSSLTQEEKDNIMKNSRDSAPADYYQCLIVKSEEPKPSLMNIISYDPYCGLLSKGSRSEYTLNLKTKKPTKKSQIQTKLSEGLCDKIIRSIPSDRQYTEGSLTPSAKVHITKKSTIKPRTSDNTKIEVKPKEGNFSNGYGEITTHSDSTWKGTWKNGKLHGIGRYENERVIYEGNYINSKWKGMGIYTDKDNNPQRIIIGKWKKNFTEYVGSPIFVQQEGLIRIRHHAITEELFADGHMLGERHEFTSEGFVKDTNWNKPNVERAEKYKIIEGIFNKYSKLNNIKPNYWKELGDILLEFEKNYDMYK